MLVLESFQAGLSWECVLNKREAFREALDDFDLEKICAYTEDKMLELQQNPGIIRNKLKFTAAVQCTDIPGDTERIRYIFRQYGIGRTEKVIFERGMAHSELSDAVSKDLKKRGMKFVGTTIIYAYLQSVGVIYFTTSNCFLEHGLS